MTVNQDFDVEYLRNNTREMHGYCKPLLESDVANCIVSVTLIHLQVYFVSFI